MLESNGRSAQFRKLLSRVYVDMERRCAGFPFKTFGSVWVVLEFIHIVRLLMYVEVLQDVLTYLKHICK